VLSPLIDQLPHVEFLGEVTDAEKAELLGNALALLSPIRWSEPFGLAVIEAMACGTPVVARPLGALPELIVDGVTGYFANTVDEMAARCAEISSLDRANCRRHVERSFSVSAMVDGYERAYRQAMILANTQRQGGRLPLAG